MRRNMLLVALLSGLFASGAVAGIFDWGDDEEEVAVTDLPATVVATVARVFPHGALQKAEKDREGEQTVYDVKVLVDKVLYSVDLTAEGKLLKVQIEDDNEDNDRGRKEVKSGDIPDGVRAAVLKVFPKGKIEDIDRGKETNAIVYKVKVKDGDQNHVVVVNEQGKVLKITESSDGKKDERDSDDEQQGEAEDSD